MFDSLSNFGETASKLTRNPLGIIALFIVLVYATATTLSALVITGGVEDPFITYPLVAFAVIFPFAILAVFYRLVVKHPEKLYAPRDFRNEENFLRKGNFLAAMKLNSAKTRQSGKGTSEDPSVTFSQLDVDSLISTLNLVNSATPTDTAHVSLNWGHVLWVEKTPSNSEEERQALEAVGVIMETVASNDEAQRRLTQNKYAAVVSSFVKTDPEAGNLQLLPDLDNKTPYFVYVEVVTPRIASLAIEHGVRNITSDPDKLFSSVLRAVQRK